MPIIILPCSRYFVGSALGGWQGANQIFNTMKKIIFLLLFMGGCATQKIYTPQVNKAPHGWNVSQWQNVIDCSFKDGKGTDSDCDSCYIEYATKYHIDIDTAILNYY